MQKSLQFVVFICENDVKLGLGKQSAFLLVIVRQDLACTSQTIIFLIGRISNHHIYKETVLGKTFSPKSRQVTKGDTHTCIPTFAASPTVREHHKPKKNKSHERFITLRHIHAPFSHLPPVLGACLASHVKGLEFHSPSLK